MKLKPVETILFGSIVSILTKKVCWNIFRIFTKNAWPLISIFRKTQYLLFLLRIISVEGLKWIQKNFPITIAPFIPGTDFLSFGAIIGKVRMTDCIIHSSSPWFFGPYGFLFTDPVEFKTPIPYRGRLKFFDVPDELIKELLWSILEKGNFGMKELSLWVLVLHARRGV